MYKNIIMYTSTKRTRGSHTEVMGLQESAYETNFIKAIDKNKQFILILIWHYIEIIGKFILTNTKTTLILLKQNNQEVISMMRLAHERLKIKNLWESLYRFLKQFIFMAFDWLANLNCLDTPLGLSFQDTQNKV